MEVELFGIYEAAHHSVLDVMVVPCRVKESILAPGYPDKVRDDCVNEQDELFEYLGPVDMMIYYN